MSCDMLTRVWNTQTEPRRKLVLVELADNTGDGFAWRADVKWLARFACCSESQAREELEALQRDGKIINVRETRDGYFEGEFARRVA